MDKTTIDGMKDVGYIDVNLGSDEFNDIIDALELKIELKKLSLSELIGDLDAFDEIGVFDKWIKLLKPIQEMVDTA